MELYAYKIMIVDDEPALRKMVSDFLKKEGFCQVVTAGSCREARQIFYQEHPHLILMDVMLPDGDGFMLLRELHEESEVPVIFLSARDEDENRLRGLGMGADDYITKPFLPRELSLRIAVVLKRVYRVRDAADAGKVIMLGDCQVDLGSGVVHRQRQQDGGESAPPMEVTLTAKEYAILEKLAANRGQIVTIDALCEAVWQDGNYGYENTLIVHIRRLREKIEQDASHPKHLQTVRGLGYKLV
ncbi:MAG: response regulator transcription factor [Lachnospiraceae bacterium]